jgi:hypothetical protein
MRHSQPEDLAMMGERLVMQESLFYAFRLEDHVPCDHLLRRIDRFVDCSELRQHLAGYYSTTGRPSVDHAMPGMTGSELIAQMRANDPGLRSLLISGYAENIPDGYGPVLRKPFTLSDLGAAVARSLQLG